MRVCVYVHYIQTSPNSMTGTSSTGLIVNVDPVGNPTFRFCLDRATCSSAIKKIDLAHLNTICNDFFEIFSSIIRNLRIFK